MAKENAKQPYSGVTWESGAIITRNKLQNIDDAASNFSNEVAEARTRSNESSNSGSLKERLDNMIIGSTNNSDITDETMLWVDTNVENYTIPVQDDFDNLVLMQNTQPDTSTYPQKANKIWVKSSEEQIEIPTTEELEQLQDTIASEYSTSKTYNVGDYVYHEGQLHRCKTSVTSAGAWNVNYWTVATLADDVSELNNDLNKLFNFSYYNNYEPATRNGLTYSWNENKTLINIFGTRTDFSFYNIINQKILNKELYYYSNIDNINIYLQLYMKNNNDEFQLIKEYRTSSNIITIPSDYIDHVGIVRLYIPNSAKINWNDNYFIILSDNESDILRMNNNQSHIKSLPQGDLDDYFTVSMTGKWILTGNSNYQNLPDFLYNAYSQTEPAIISIEHIGQFIFQTITLLYLNNISFTRFKHLSNNTQSNWKTNNFSSKMISQQINIDELFTDGYYFNSIPTNYLQNYPFDAAGFLEVLVAPQRNISTATKVIIQRAWPYNDFSNNKPCFRIYQLGTWTDWQEFGGLNTINNYNYNYNNTYNDTITPTITTDTNNWLQPVDTILEADESNKTDMTPAIMAMLNNTGYCHLAPGVYYISGNIDMPDNSTLIGCGNKTIIKLLNSTTSGYCIKINTRNTVRDISFVGDTTSSFPTINDEAARHAIYFFSDQHGAQTLPTPDCCVISNCRFRRFIGSGIYGYDTGGSLNTTLIVSDCYFDKCFVGINLAYRCEYCKFTNIITYRCYYGCINNGGNNTFSACTFHGTIGFMIDNENNQSGNSGHGTATGCTFNHIDNQNNPSLLGSGDAIICKNTPHGFVFTGCQIWYGDIRIYNSIGISISNSQIGNSKTAPEIEVTGSYPVFFSNCVFSQIPIITAPSNSHFDNCYLAADGSSISI